MKENLQQPEVSWQLQSSEILKTYSDTKITKESRIRPDGSKITYTILTETGLESDIWGWNLLIDPRFNDKGIVTGANSLLIDQGETAKVWGLEGNETPGIKPESWLEEFDNSDGLTPAMEMLAFPATNSLWQKGGIFISSGRIVHLPNDETLKPSLETLVLTQDGWSARNIDLTDKNLDKTLPDIRIGMSMPMVIENGILVPQNKISEGGDPRALADLRNFIDFSDGAYLLKDFDSRFFALMRKFQPSTKLGSIGMINKGHLILVESLVTKQEAMLFKSIVKDPRWNLGIHFDVRNIGDEATPTQVIIEGPFPKNRIPVTLIGHDEKGKLTTGFFDGRQEKSTGVTIDEAAEIMLEKGAVNAGIGVAGGDVAIIQKIQGVLRDEPTFSILNSPANKNHQTRPTPNMLVLKTPDWREGHIH